MISITPAVIRINRAQSSTASFRVTQGGESGGYDDTDYTLSANINRDNINVFPLSFSFSNAGQFIDINIEANWDGVDRPEVASIIIWKNNTAQTYMIPVMLIPLTAYNEKEDNYSLTSINVFPNMESGSLEESFYFSPREHDIILVKAKNFNYSGTGVGNNLAWNVLTENVSVARNWYNAPYSAYTTAQWTRGLSNIGSCSSLRDTGFSQFYTESEWDYVWIKFDGGDAIIQLRSEDEFKTLHFYASGTPVVTPNWIAESSLTGSYNPSFLQFRHDLRNALYNVIDQKVREVVGNDMSRLLRFENEDDAKTFQILYASNCERVERIDNYIKQLEYKTEQALNVIGDEQIQSMYTSIYRTLQDYDSKLKEFINDTLEKAIINYQNSEALLLELEQKNKKETLVQYNSVVRNIELSKLQVILHTQRTNEAWDITQYISNKNDQLMISIPPISTITGLTNIDSFVPWYIYIWPKSKIISNYIILSNRRIQFIVNNDLTEILWGNLYDSNGQSYKIINKDDDGWILDKNIDQNIIGTDLIFYPNYFDPQIIKLDIAWLHNYIPKNIPLGTTWRPPTQNIEEIIEPIIDIPSEIVVYPEIKESNKEIF